MTQPVPEEDNEAYDLDEAPDDEHESTLPGDAGASADPQEPDVHEENAGTTDHQPSQ